METESHPKTLGDLLQKRQLKPEKRMSERASVIQYFHERAKDKNGKQFSAAYIGRRLSHLTLLDLYAFKSMLEDRSRTQNNFNWNKMFFGMLKVKNFDSMEVPF